ncbi:MAG: TolC family protein [Gemmatimonadaceae bacterium]
MKYRLILAACLTLTATLSAQEQRALTLADAVALAQRQGLAAEAARSQLESARWADRAFSASLLPRLGLVADAPSLVNRSIDAVPQPDGSTAFVPVRVQQGSLLLGVTQRLPFTGGDLTVGSGLSRTRSLASADGQSWDQSWRTTPFEVRLSQSILRPREVVWDRRERASVNELAERQYLEAREEIAASTSAAYFDLFAAQASLQNAEANAAVNDSLYVISKGRFEVGKIGENDLLQSELALLRARASVDAARLERDRAEASLRRLTGVRDAAPLVVTAPPTGPAVEVDPSAAATEALRNSSVVELAILQRTQASRRVNAARLGSLPGATVTASAGFNQTASAFDLVYRDLLERQQFGVRVDMPLLQWGGGKAAVQAARADAQRVESQGRARREELEQEARFAALQLSQAQRVLAISAKADTVAAKRFDVAKNRYMIGRIGIDNLFVAQSEKDAALLAYVAALRGYWTAYYRLRRVTLHDFAEGRPVGER